MRRNLFVLIAASGLCLGQKEVRHSEEVAMIATAMLDGDLCLKIQTPRSLQFATQRDPRDPWRAADNYDVDADAFIQTKKTLIRLAHLCPETCDINLWMRVSSKPDRVSIVIRNVHEMSQFWNWGDLDSELPPEMKRVLAGSEQMSVHKKPGMLSVLAPVYDSLGNVVAIAEVVSEKLQDPQENVK